MRDGIIRPKTKRLKNYTSERANLNWILLKVYCQFRIDASRKGVMLILEKMLEKQNSEIITDVIRLTNDMKKLVGTVLRYTTKGRITIGYRLKGNKIEFYISSSENGTIQDYKDLISGLSYSASFNDYEDENLIWEGEAPQLLKIKAEKKNGCIMLISDPGRGSEICLSVFNIKSSNSLQGT